MNLCDGLWKWVDTRMSLPPRISCECSFQWVVAVCLVSPTITFCNGYTTLTVSQCLEFLLESRSSIGTVQKFVWVNQFAVSAIQVVTAI